MPLLTRRSFGLAALGTPLAAGLAATQIATPALAAGHATGTPAVYGAKIGNYQVTAISDGTIGLPKEFFFGPAPEEIDAVLDGAGANGPVLPAPVTAYLLTSDTDTILIDAGMGAVEAFGPGFGNLTAGLASVGVAPSDVTKVIVTHAHPDHIGGMLGEGSVFPNAEIMVTEVELGFWTNEAMAAQAPEGAQGLFQMAAGFAALYSSQITMVQDGAELAPGLTLQLSPGHTPGHAVIRIDGGDTQMIMVADTLHNVDLHTALPEIGFGFDTDTALAAQSRVALFDQLSADKTLICGSHIHFPGFGRIVRAGDAYRYVPATVL